MYDPEGDDRITWAKVYSMTLERYGVTGLIFGRPRLLPATFGLGSTRNLSAHLCLRHGWNRVATDQQIRRMSRPRLSLPTISSEMLRLPVIISEARARLPIIGSKSFLLSCRCYIRFNGRDRIGALIGKCFVSYASTRVASTSSSSPSAVLGAALIRDAMRFTADR
jgi:hypothetical protein